MNLKTLTIIAFVFLFSLNTHAQKQNLIGLNLYSEIYPETIRPRVGITFEKKITKRSGGETGLFYRTHSVQEVVTYNDASGSHSYFFTVSQRYLTVPVLYKYYSRLANFSAGPAFDFYVGWKQKKDATSFQIQSYNVYPKIKIGFLTKISKPIPLNKKFIIEPEIRFGSVQTVDEASLGIGIAGKYRF